MDSCFMSWTNISEKSTICAKISCAESLDKDHHFYFLSWSKVLLVVLGYSWGWKWSTVCEISQKEKISEIHNIGSIKWPHSTSSSTLKDSKWYQKNHHLSPYLVLVFSPNVCSLQLRYITFTWLMQVLFCSSCVLCNT